MILICDDQEEHGARACPAYAEGPVRPVHVRAARLPSLQDGELVAQEQDFGGLPRLLVPG